jgi:uncharacterized protein
VINIKLSLSHDHSVIEVLVIEGHSGYRAKGEDIVCSAVSILSYTFLVCIKNINKIDFDYLDQDDIFNIKIQGYNKELKSELSGISLFLINGLKLLEKKYKDYIRLIIE